MTMQIQSIVLYSHSGETRELNFKHGDVNIITGRSLTGKSSIIEIIHYCLGYSSFGINEGAVRERVAWFAVTFAFGDGTEVMIAKPVPEGHAKSQSQAYIEIGSSLKVPPFTKLSPNTNDDGVQAELSRRLGIAPNLHVPQLGQTREALEAGVQHTDFYLFQPQNVIANKDILFYRQVEEFMPQTIKDTLPYFLGVVSSERIAIEHDLKLARRRLKIAQRDLDEAKFVASDQLTRGRTLIEEAKQAGILPATTDAKAFEDVVRLLNDVMKWKPSAPPLEADKVTDWRRNVDQRRDRLRAISRQLEAAQVFDKDSQGYATEVGEQLMRLRSIELFHSDDVGRRCPLCANELTAEVPAVAAITETLQHLRADLDQVEAEKPRLREYIESMKTERDATRQSLADAEFTLQAAIAEDEAAQVLRDANARAARVAGRISLYLETLRLSHRDERLQRAIEQETNEVNRLAMLLKVDSNELLTSALNSIGGQMTKWADELQLEHKGQYRVDANNLTVVIDIHGRPVPMEKISGGHNWLGCHLIALLSLHYHFIVANCPVPGFLVLDQPSQVYFPSVQQYKQLSGSTQETANADADLEAVRRMFNLLWSVCAQMKGDLQVVVLEHANLPENRFQQSLVEQAPWTGAGSHALVPEHWAARPVDAD
ncbi:MAG TPA: DUF3732 domain-containing protein [Candidatus Angelobacter sp.]